MQTEVEGDGHRNAVDQDETPEPRDVPLPTPQVISQWRRLGFEGGV